jgi:WD40 repeat protein
VAVLGLADFTIYEVTPTFEVNVICWGDITQRYAPMPKPAIEQRSLYSYHRAALAEEIIAIASFQTFIDIRNAKTGQRIHQLRLEAQSNIRVIVFSPDGQHLAVGLKTGDIFVFHSGLRYEFSTPPIRVRNEHESPIISITISHDSLLMVVSTQDNVVRAYRLRNLSDGHFEEWIQPIKYGTRNKPAPISDLALYDSIAAF